MGKEEMVQPGVRQHAPEGMQVADLRVGGGFPFLQHYYGTFPAIEKTPFLLRYICDL
jgi:hypothetical protein